MNPFTSGKYLNQNTKKNAVFEFVMNRINLAAYDLTITGSRVLVDVH